MVRARAAAPTPCPCKSKRGHPWVAVKPVGLPALPWPRVCAPRGCSRLTGVSHRLGREPGVRPRPARSTCVGGTACGGRAAPLRAGRVGLWLWAGWGPPLLGESGGGGGFSGGKKVRKHGVGRFPRLSQELAACVSETSKAAEPIARGPVGLPCLTSTRGGGSPANLRRGRPRPRDSGASAWGAPWVS